MEKLSRYSIFYDQRFGMEPGIFDEREQVEFEALKVQYAAKLARMKEQLQVRGGLLN